MKKNILLFLFLNMVIFSCSNNKKDLIDTPEPKSKNIKVKIHKSTQAPFIYKGGFHTSKKNNKKKPANETSKAPIAKIRVFVLSSGVVQKVELVQSSGFRELDNLSIESAKKEYFEPLKLKSSEKEKIRIFDLDAELSQ